MKLLHFIFQDLFTFFGTVILIWVITSGIAEIILAFKGVAQ